MESFYCHGRSLPAWRDGLLILLYHAIERPPLRHRWRGLYVEPGLLRRQLAELQQLNIPFVPLDEALAASAAGRRVALTFDDAFRNLITHALPVLQELRVPSITYVVADLIGDSNRWDHAAGAQHLPLMDRAEIHEWIAAGQTIGSHGLSHRDLTTLSLDEARREIVDSKKKLEDLTGHPVRHFCYPYGAHNEALRDLVREAGYLTATGTEPALNFPDTDPYNLHRYLARHRYPLLSALPGFPG